MSQFHRMHETNHSNDNQLISVQKRHNQLSMVSREGTKVPQVPALGDLWYSTS